MKWRVEKLKTATVIRFVHFEDLGTLQGALATRGYDVKYVEAVGGEVGAMDPLASDLLICLGGPIGAYEEHSYPILKPILKAVERRIAAGRPLLGICLGSQIIARALGARVYPGGWKEIGWSPLRLTRNGRAGFMRHIGPECTRVLHWHGDTFDLPDQAVLLASSEIYANQAFAFGNVLALQFHAEVTSAGLERWYVGHACEIASTPRLEVAALRAEARLFAPALEASAAGFFSEWLDQIATGTSRSLSVDPPSSSPV
jgi:GMP synthase (glutamine-hydrolysing)